MSWLRAVTILLAVLAFSSTVVDSQSAPFGDRHVVLRITLDGKPLPPLFRVFLSSAFGTVEAAVDGKGFVVPHRFAVLERVGVRVEVDGFSLDIGEIYTTKLACDWTLAIDSKPFAPDLVESMARTQVQEAHLIAVITFESHLGDGTELVCTWYDDSYRIDGAMPPN